MPNSGNITVYGIDFTSNPIKGKPITCATCRLVGNTLRFDKNCSWDNFQGFEDFLNHGDSNSPWIAGIDSPFSLAFQFIQNNGWPIHWAEYVHGKVETLNDKREWVDILEKYKKYRCKGDKEHLRATDKIAGSVSPQKLYGVPVGRMFLECAPRLRKSGVLIPGLQSGDCNRIVVEAYPSVAVRQLVGKVKYKAETKKKQTPKQKKTRRYILQKLTEEKTEEIYGLRLDDCRQLQSLADDPKGDSLDALVCALQAAWAWRNRETNFGLPRPANATEGWIADPIWNRSAFNQM